MESIAIPPLCTLISFPKGLVAVLTLQTILEFWRDNPTSPPKHVRITSFDLESTAFFREEFERRQSQNFAVTPLPKSEREIAALLPKKSDADLSELFESFGK